jgi:DNA-binding transcriptional regulator YiaG
MAVLAVQYKAIERDPILAQFQMVRKATGMSKAQICRISGVSTSCLRNWERDGKTKRPQHLTLVFAFRAMGYRFGKVEKIHD